MEIIMDNELPSARNAQAWQARVLYHQDRAAHRLLGEHHLQLAASAALVADMPDAEMPQSLSLQHTGWLMRKSYGDVT